MQQNVNPLYVCLVQLMDDMVLYIVLNEGVTQYIV